jgi:hypothetical protein
MATQTRPCPYCGAAVLMNAPACGTCGRPMPPVQAGAPGGGQPAKTMFGHAAPALPQMRPGTPQPGQPMRPGAPQGFTPPQQQGFTPPQQQGFGPQSPAYPQAQQPQPAQAPQPANPYGQPPQAQQPANPYGAPQQGQPPGPYGQPPSPYGQPPQPQSPMGGPPMGGSPMGAPQQNPYGAPPGGAPAYGQPPQPAAPPAYGQPPQGGFGGPAAGGFGAPQQNPYGQPQPQGGFGGPQPGYPQAPNPYGQPQQDMPGPLDDMARRIPLSPPGTLFGFPIGKLRDPSLQKKILFLAGVALLASIVVPYQLNPTQFSFSEGVPKFTFLVWPIIAGGLYLLVAAAPAELRRSVPPVVLQWIPFAVSLLGIFFIVPSGAPASVTVYLLGYATLVFGLLARIAQPNDQIARIVIVVGAGMLLPLWIDSFDHVFKFSGHKVLDIVDSLLGFLVTTLGVLCAIFVVPPQKLPPALKSVDAFGPLICAVLIVWLPLHEVLEALSGLVHHSAGVSALLKLAHGLLPILAYFGVLMMAAPAAYEEAKALIAGNRGGGGGYPPQGGGYPPQGGGYPPQGGGYPPQGGGYPPQGGGYPPQGQGGGYPPQGGGYPPQGGGGWQ